MVRVQIEGEPVEEVEKEVEAFNTFFQEIGNGPMNRFEVAILKTYLAWKVKTSEVGPPV